MPARHFIRWSACPECGSPRRERAWRDPIAHRDYTATVEHEPGCRIYRERDFDRVDGTAHLQAIDGRSRFRSVDDDDDSEARPMRAREAT